LRRRTIEDGSTVNTSSRSGLTALSASSRMAKAETIARRCWSASSLSRQKSTCGATPGSGDASDTLPRERGA
jgi:hypothetical protein